MPTLTIERSLLSYEAPLVVLASDSKGADLIGVNYGDTDTCHSFYFSRVKPAPLQSFLEGGVDLLYLLTKKHTGKFHLGAGSGAIDEQISTKLVDTIDRDLLPEPGVFMPSPPKEASTATRAVHIDGRWGINDLRKFSDLVQDSYAFVFALTGRGTGHTRDRITELFQKYPWRGGFSSVNFFNDLYRLIPPPQRASISRIQYASPGTIELQMNKEAASAIRKLCEAINQDDSEIVERYEEVHTWLRERNWLGRSASDLRLSAPDKRELLDVTAKLAETFGLATQKSYILKLSNSDPLAAVKILLAYYRRLEGLADYVATGKAGELFV
jgi:hypothetical protein